MWWCFAELAARLGVGPLPGIPDPARGSDDDVIAGLTGRGRPSFESLRSSPTAVVSDAAVFGWVEQRVLPDGRWRLAPQVLVEQLRSLQNPAPLVLVPRRPRAVTRTTP